MSVKFTKVTSGIFFLGSNGHSEGNVYSQKVTKNRRSVSINIHDTM